MNKHKEIKINDIYDIELGDIIFFSDGGMGFVYYIGETIIHNHKYVKVISINENDWEKCTCGERDFTKGEIILRSLK